MDRSSPLPAAGQPAPLPTQSTLRRAIGASALGNAVEWFDYGIYAYGVTYISVSYTHLDVYKRQAMTITS